MNIFKVVLTGPSNVGKTAMIKKLLTGEDTTNYISTLGVEVHPITFNTNYGFMTCNTWDTSGNNLFRGNFDEYCSKADGVLLCGFSKHQSYIEPFASEAKLVVPNAKYIVCYMDNKVNNILDYPFINIDVKSLADILKAFERLLQLLAGYHDLVILS